MSARIHVTPEVLRTDPELRGLDISASEWRLDTEEYRAFIQAVTGISPTDGLSTTDCYRIGNRLQALIEERKRRGEWDRSLVETYSDVESLEEFVWLARFFRACHDCHDAGEICLPDCADRAAGE